MASEQENGLRLPIIGITGNIGSGKSTVAEVFAEQGARRIDGDTLGRDVVDESEEFQKWLRDRFGEAIFSSGSLDRAALGNIVFRDETARDQLNRQIWPHIRRRLEQSIEQARREERIPVVDAALIFEWGDEERYDLILAVLVDPELGADRAARRLGRPAEEMMDRYRMQLSVQRKRESADLVLNNDGSIEELRQRALEIWHGIEWRARAGQAQRESSS